MASPVPVPESAAESMRTDIIRVFLFVENRLLHEALLHIFRKRRDFRIVGGNCDRDARPAHLLDSKCDVLVTESLSTESLLSALAVDGFSGLSFKAVLIGMDADEQQFLSAVRFGVTGYLLKDASASDVVAAIRAVHRGGAVCPPQLSPVLFRLAAKASREILSGASAKPHFTSRQQQLAALLAKGFRNKKITLQPNLARYTVRNHILRIFKQMDARRHDEAVQAIRASGYAVSSLVSTGLANP